MAELTGEVVITKEDDSIEIEVSSSKLATPRLYAFALTDALEGFFASLAAAMAATAVAVRPALAVEEAAMGGAKASKRVKVA